MRIRGFHHLAIQVQKLEEQAAFYRDVLGLSEMVRHLRPDGSVRSVWIAIPDEGCLALEAVDGEPERSEFRHSRPGLLILALRIERSERAAWIARLTTLGIPVVHQSRWTVYFRDPEGNRIALSHHPED